MCLPRLLTVTSCADHEPHAIIFWSVYLHGYLLLTRVAAVCPSNCREAHRFHSEYVVYAVVKAAMSAEIVNRLPTLPVQMSLYAYDNLDPCTCK